MKLLVVCNSRCASGHILKALFKKNWGKKVKIRSSPGPSRTPDPYVARVLKELGLSPRKKKLKALKKSDLHKPDRLIVAGLKSLNAGRVPIRAPIERWQIPYPLRARNLRGELKHEQLRRYRHVRDYLLKRILRFENAGRES